MQNFSTLSQQAIIVEHYSSDRLIWLWPIASGLLFGVGYFLFQGAATAFVIGLLFAMVPLAIWTWIEFNGESDQQAPLLTWHKNRLYLYSKGQLTHKIYSDHIEHIELVHGIGYSYLIIHSNERIIRQKFIQLTRGQKLQIQRVVRMLEAEINYKKHAFALNDELEEIRKGI